MENKELQLIQVEPKQLSRIDQLYEKINIKLDLILEKLGQRK